MLANWIGNSDLIFHLTSNSCDVVRILVDEQVVFFLCHPPGCSILLFCTFLEAYL